MASDIRSKEISVAPQPQDTAGLVVAAASKSPQQGVPEPIPGLVFPALATFPYLSRTACRISSLSLLVMVTLPFLV
jgi:hypothetical protein